MSAIITNQEKDFKKWMDGRLIEYEWTLEDLSRESGVGRQTIVNHRKDGNWTLKQFRAICRSLRAPEDIIIRFIIRR